MDIFQQSQGLDWEESTGGDTVAELIRSVPDYRRFNCVDTYFVEPSMEYIVKCLETTSIKGWITHYRHLTSIFMVTGLKIARGGETGLHAASR